MLSATATPPQPTWPHCQRTPYGLHFAERVTRPSSLASQYRAARVGRTNSSCWFNAVRTDLNSTTCPRQFRDPRSIEHSPRKLTSKERGINSGAIGRLSGAHYEYRARHRGSIGEGAEKLSAFTARRKLRSGHLKVRISRTDKLRQNLRNTGQTGSADFNALTSYAPTPFSRPWTAAGTGGAGSSQEIRPLVCASELERPIVGRSVLPQGAEAFRCRLGKTVRRRRPEC